MGEDIRPETAVRAAKKWLAEVYAEEAIERITLEEIRFREGNWEITLGFNRRYHEDQSGDVVKEIDKILMRGRRVYKVLILAGNDNHVMEMRDREVA